MRTIEESIAVLERWRKLGRGRTWIFMSSITAIQGLQNLYSPPSVDWCGDDCPSGRLEGETIQEALDRAASEVSK